MILAIKAFKDLAEYLAGGNSEGFEAARPGRCPGPRRCQCRLWRHTAYERTAIDGSGTRIKVTIQRYRCPGCGLTVSCLFDFLVPYLRFTVQAMAGYLEWYLRQWTSYEELAWSVDAESLPSKSSIFRWVSRLAERSRRLAAAIQREAVLSQSESALVEVEPVECPNAIKAKKPGKAGELNEAAECMLLTERLLAGPLFAEDSTLTTLQRYFATAAETAWSILTGRVGVVLSTQQSVKYTIF